MYEFRWEWITVDDNRRRFLGNTKEDVVRQVAEYLRLERAVPQPTQTLLRHVASMIRPASDTVSTRWKLRSPLAKELY